MLDQADPGWIAVALAFNVLAFFAYVALFRGVVGEHVLHLEWRESYQITMAGLAATRLFSAGGAGGIVLTYWALRKAGMPRRQTACRMVAFLVLLYGVYMIALVDRRRPPANRCRQRRDAPVGLTVVPAVIAAGVIVIFLLVTLIPSDLERRFAAASRQSRRGRLDAAARHRPRDHRQRHANGDRLRAQSRSAGGLAILGAVGFWAAEHRHPLGLRSTPSTSTVPLAVVIQGFFVGMVANLFPFAPGGVGARRRRDDRDLRPLRAPRRRAVFAAVLAYRVIAFWLPIPPGIVAFFQLRKTVARWERERRRAAGRLRAGRVAAGLRAAGRRRGGGRAGHPDGDRPEGSITSQSEVRCVA